MPNVREHSDYSAEEILVNDGFRIKSAYDCHSGYASRGVAWGTEPATGTMRSPGCPR